MEAIQLQRQGVGESLRGDFAACCPHGHTWYLTVDRRAPSIKTGPEWAVELSYPNCTDCFGAVGFIEPTLHHERVRVARGRSGTA